MFICSYSFTFILSIFLFQYYFVYKQRGIFSNSSDNIDLIDVVI